MLIKILILFSLLLYGSLIIGELVARKKPNSKFSKWWRRQIINECEKCD